MRCSLALNSREPGEGEIDPDVLTAMQEAFGAYGRALESAGVLVAAEVLQRSDMTTTVTTDEGQVCVFVAVDHCTAECVGIHAAKSGNRFEALEPLRQGVREHFASRLWNRSGRECASTSAASTGALPPGWRSGSSDRPFSPRNRGMGQHGPEYKR